ncbi:nuclear transport factor 2 family protein [Streptomyces sp. NPDC049040]|uniref:nuclear transport factor 2 family protein n=1 Tax=Streptomyces sp. NPDC049040 TaxID=3365593 RepID=UPI003710629F
MTATSEATERAARRLLLDYTRDIGQSDEDPAVVVDRTMTDDVVWFSDGAALTREQLIAHAAPVRKNVISGELLIDELLVDGGRFAARCRMAVEHRKLGRVSMDWILMGEVADDGRVRRVHQLARTA